MSGKGILNKLSNSSASLVDFAHKLEQWFEANQRPLPWRLTTDPYRILVSETMLQQTRVETVIPYYHRFLERFPNVSALANADEADVLKLWEGLGYYSRARNLQNAMRVVEQEHGGVIPSDAVLVRKLPGVGPYTTGAVMSIAFNTPLAAVDGNVLRVMSRFLGISDWIDEIPVKRDITLAVQKAIEVSVPRVFTQALMELGAMVCVPRHPQCLICPMKDGCFAADHGQTDVLPRKRPKKARRQVTVVALWIEYERQLLVEQRASSGLLADMWQLPAFELAGSTNDENEFLQMARSRLNDIVTGHKDDEPVLLVREASGSVASDFVTLAKAKHIFTHLEWDVVVLRPVGYHHLSLPPVLADNQRFVPIDELHQLAWPKVYTSILGEVLQQSVMLRGRA